MTVPLHTDLPAAGDPARPRPREALWLLVPAAVCLWTASFLGRDVLPWLLWQLVTLALGLAVWPLALRVTGSCGPSLVTGRAIGLLLVSLLQWELSYLGLVPFRGVSLWLLAGIIAALNWLPGHFRGAGRAAQALSSVRGRRDLLLFEALFLLIAGLWAVVRSRMPAIDGLEKFMDYGFMMSLWRTDWLPAKDMWLAGQPINYYYYGQYAYTVLDKMSGILPATGYNLSLGSSMAWLFTLSGALLYRLFRSRPVLQWPAVLLGGFMTTFAGNSHAFFYSDNGPGRGLLLLLERLGVTIGTLKPFYFADSTRFIGYNPDVADKTIHEFPYYSYLVSDLHAHVCNTVFVLLLLNLLAHLWLKAWETSTLPDGPRPLREGSVHLRRTLVEWALEPAVWLTALLLAVSMMANYWDFVIYYVVLWFFVLSFALRRTGSFGGLPGLFAGLLSFLLCFLPYLFVQEAGPQAAALLAGTAAGFLLASVLPGASTLAALQVNLVFTFAHIVSLPFNLRLDPMPKVIRPAQYHSSLLQLVVLWGPQLLIALGFVLWLCLRHVRARREGSRASGGLNRLAIWLRALPARDWIMVIFTVSALGLILAPEFAYVRDIYESGYARANTMFKFTYQAFILLGLVIACAPLRALDAALSSARAGHQGRPGRRRTVLSGLLAGIWAMLLVLPAWYPFAATSQWIPDLATAPNLGLDGTDWMEEERQRTVLVGDQRLPYTLDDDAAAIDWLNSYVTGQPVILEAAGLSYTHFNRISAYTGLPTVMGWETHEWLWRTSVSTPYAYPHVVLPRQDDVRSIYSMEDPEEAARLLDHYQVEYLIIGSLERAYYPDLAEDELRALGTVVFEQDSIAIVQLD